MKLTKARNGSKRSVGLNIEAVRVLQSLPRSTEKVIKGYYETGKLDCDFKAACVAAGLLDLHFHDLRHEAATRLAPHMMLQELTKIMGWKTLQMVMRYYNPTAQELAARMRAVEAARSEPLPGAANALAVPRAIELASGTTVGVPAQRVGDPTTSNVIRVQFLREMPSRTRYTAVKAR